MAADKKRQIQLERLQATLNRACKKVVFHRNRLAGKNGNPAAVESLENLANLPFMDRSHLGENYPYGLFAVPLRDIVRIHTAPGTLSANPTVTGYTRQDLDMWMETVGRGLFAAGVGPEDILQISLGGGLANWGRDYKDGAAYLGASVIPNTPLSVEKQLMIIKDYRTSALVSTHTTALFLAERLKKSEISPSALSLRTLILVGEPAETAIRDRLAQDLGVTTWQHYGLSEVPGPALAFECRAHEGLHVNDDHFYPEIIDPDTGRPLAPGQTGELVLTSLTTRAFPLIRFRTGDRARIISEPCSCGLDSVRIQWLLPRCDDLISIRGVKIHQGQIRRQLCQSLGYTPACIHFTKSRLGADSFLEIWVAVDLRLFSDEIKGLERLMQTVSADLEQNMGIPVVVRLKEQSSLECHV